MEHHCPTGRHDPGTPSCYTNHKCGCDPCRESATEYQRRYRRRKRAAYLQGVEPTRGWEKDAACRGMDVQTFYDPEQMEEAIQVCEGCEVRRQCLSWARTHGEHGVWGGVMHTGRRVGARDTDDASAAL